ncbi:MAG: hypothetical protein ABL890_00160 [Candidatus Peribacteraceae bacterium]
MESKHALLTTITHTLENLNDDTNCGFAHEFENNGLACHESIADRRIGCPHNTQMDVLRNAVRALFHEGHISNRTHQKVSQNLDILRRELENLDDTAAGLSGFIDREKIVAEQQTIIKKRSRYRRAILNTCYRCLKTLTSPPNSQASPEHTLLS